MFIRLIVLMAVLGVLSTSCEHARVGVAAGGNLPVTSSVTGPMVAVSESTPASTLGLVFDWPIADHLRFMLAPTYRGQKTTTTIYGRAWSDMEGDTITINGVFSGHTGFVDLDFGLEWYLPFTDTTWRPVSLLGFALSFTDHPTMNVQNRYTWTNPSYSRSMLPAIGTQMYLKLGVEVAATSWLDVTGLIGARGNLSSDPAQLVYRASTGYSSDHVEVATLTIPKYTLTAELRMMFRL